MNSLHYRVALALARAFLRPPLDRFGFRAPTITRLDSMEAWTADRLSEVETYRELFAPFTSFRDKTVLDLGCNRGYLLNSFLQHEDFRAIGADISEQDLETARKDYGWATFIRSTPSSLPLPSNSIDVVYTIDTVEHLSKAREMFADVYRVLKPGGMFLVHFNPWLNPYGSHLEDVIPFPWPHVLFSMDVLLDAAATLYDLPDHKTAAYWFDNEGRRRPNPYRDKAHWAKFLNHMTIRRFNQMLTHLPFEILYQERIGFGGKTFKAGRLLRGLSQVPILSEFFTNALFTVLQKPQG